MEQVVFIQWKRSKSLRVSPKALHISSSSVTLPGKEHGDKSLVPAGKGWAVLTHYCLLTEPVAPSVELMLYQVSASWWGTGATELRSQPAN